MVIGLEPVGAPSLGPVWRRWRVVLIAVAVVWLVATVGTVALLVEKLRPLPIPTGSLPGDLGVPKQAQAAFADPENGYLLLGRCPTEACETWVAATHDGGRSWDGAIVPGLTFGRDAPAHGLPSPRLIVLDAQHAVLDDAGNLQWAQEQGQITERGRRWSTSDGGRSWAPVELGPVDVVDRVPPGAYVESDVVFMAPTAVVLRLIREDGTSAVVAPADDRLHGLMAVSDRLAADGSLWVVTAFGSTRGPIMVSRDRGRTWDEVKLPPAASGRTLSIDPTDGRTLYLVDQDGVRVWRSSDAGTTWRELPAPLADEQDAELVPLMGLPDGRLVVLNSGSFFVIAAHGQSFEPVDHDFMQRAWALLNGGRLLSTAGGSLVLLDVEGRSVRVPFGCLPGCYDLWISMPLSRY